ncbi:MAG: SAP domain-containing protein [Nitrospinae bacterium]|nr:SAP domain-containing protein [Nitrospinota bacterium]
MKLQEIKDKAKGLGIKTSKIKKGDLVRSIQTAEGNIPCFESSVDYCDQKDCCWRPDCLNEK